MGRQHCPNEVDYIPCETGFRGGRLLALARAIERLVARKTSPEERRRVWGLCCTSQLIIDLGCARNISLPCEFETHYASAL